MQNSYADKDSIQDNSPTGPSASKASLNISITWFGHSTFLIKSSSGTSIITDPYDAGGSFAQDMESDIVTISHEHYDHNVVKNIKGTTKILRGLKENKVDAMDIKIKDIRIYNVASFHDEEKGKKRGVNSIFAYEVDGMKIVHLGDLGHVLELEQTDKLKDIDILLIPVGGTYTIDPDGAIKVVEQLKPKVVIPMHYKTDAIDFVQHSVKDFLKGKQNIKELSTKTLSINKSSLPKDTAIYVLQYK